MKLTTSKLFFFVFLSLFMVNITMAQEDYRGWVPTEGIALRQGTHIEWYRGGEARDEGELAGEVAFTWSDCRFGDRGVFAQIIDVDGNIKYEHPGGLSIADSSGRQEDPGIWPDPVDGGWFVAWEDFDIWYDEDLGEMVGDSLGDIYCTKIDAQGNIIWGDDARGVPVVVHPGIQEGVRIVEDGQGGCIIAWKDQRGGDTGDLYSMHITADGVPDLDWPENGLAIVEEPGPQTSHTADIDGAGGMIIGWKDGRVGGDFNVWAQRITPDGDLVWGNGEGIPICNHAGSTQESPKMCPDGAGGAFFTWVDNRNANQTNKDIYGQRVDRDGNLLWGPANEGIPICTAEEEQLGNRIVISEPGTAIVTWDDKRANGEEYDIYAMRITGVNQMEKTWGNEQGEIVVTEPRNQAQVRLYPDDEGGAFFIWEDERDGGFPEIDIWAQRLNANGQRVWADVGVPVCRTPGNQNSPLIRQVDADGGCIVAWGDLRSGSFHFYMQRLNANGEPVWDANGILAAGGHSGNAIRPDFIPHYDSDNSFAVLWMDGRYGVRGNFPFFQYCQSRGDDVEIVLETHGRPVMSGNLNGGGVDPHGTVSSDGGIIVVWEDHREGESYSIYAQKADVNGNLLWGDNGVKCANFDYDQEDPMVVSDGEGGAIVVWKAPTDNLIYDVYAQRLNSQGQPLWGDNGIHVTSGEDDEYVESIVPDGEGGVVLVYKVLALRSDDDLKVQRLNANGEPVWVDGAMDGGKNLILERYKQRDAILKRHQNGFVVVWIDGRDDEIGQSQDDVYGQFIEMDGTYRWEDGGAIICGAEGHQQNASVTIDNNAHIWVTWEDYRFVEQDNKRDIYVQKISQHLDENDNLHFFFDFDGEIVCSFEGDQAVPQIAHDAHNGAYITWEDYRTGIWSNVFATHLQPNGVPYAGWERNSGNPVCEATHKQDTPHVMRAVINGQEQAVFTWEDKRATGKEELSNVFVQAAVDELTAVPENGQAAQPVNFNLETIYPNPFNSSTLISFTMRNEGMVKFEVFDISGRLIDVIANGYQSAGRHVMVLDGSEVSAGTYIVRMTVDNQYMQRKVQLIK